MSLSPVGIYTGAGIGAYGYEEKPWFLPGRLNLFLAELAARGLDRRAAMIEGPRATDEELLLFHTPAHLERVRRLCAAGLGALDHGPTLARPGIEIAATHVVGAVLDAARKIVEGDLGRAFVPIAGFHHAHPEEARAYCLYNDPAILLKWLQQQRIGPLAYVDVDVHHGDGVHAAFAADPSVFIADVHEDGRTLFPHSPEAPGPGPFPGDRKCTGEGAARGTKLNLPLAAGATDADFDEAWEEIEAFVDRAEPAFIVLEAGADGLAGDPMAHLALTPESLRKATWRLRALAERHAGGRLLVLGGGGYAEGGMVSGWCAVVEALLQPQR